MQNYPYPYAQNNQFTYYSNPKNSKKSDKIESEKDKTKEVYEKNTGMYWKINGNEAYKIKNYLLAIKCYSKAIVNINKLRN
jgi:tetratricopeptide (TPR) repeat protein